MSYDQMPERTRLPFDKTKIMQGGPALAEYLKDLIDTLENEYYGLARYVNFYRTWTHASDFTKLDGGDHYAGSIQTAAAALNAWTDPQSALTVATTPISPVWTVEQTLAFNSKGLPLVLFWGASPGFLVPATTVSLRLYRDLTLLQTIGPLLTVTATSPTLSCCYLDSPSAGDVTYTLQASTAAGGTAVVGNIYIVALECKR